ncbi:hypothetical protein AMURIS_02230 [Acetatifactor muris]|uniref:Uncharacterized protein n=1 Tax=Acetatifactor muris TaxID=879566 RepID=A0A2K4ZGB8_9FIRM|nr:hypothetical protein [Acetatifactor muris]SOY29509.1 hypothetical protein AMURIS_02230 [Acetatifactor muris]
MDTIIYFLKKKGLKEPLIEPVGLKSHMLIRVSLDVEEEDWFGISFRMAEPGYQSRSASEAAEMQKQEKQDNRSSMWHPLKALRQMYRVKKEAGQEKRRRRAEALEQEKLLAEREERIGRTEEAIGRLLRDIKALAEEERDCCCVYENKVRKALLAAEKCVLSFLWQKYFDFPEFTDYAGSFWVKLLMPQAVWPHFVILGTAPCLYAVLEEAAHRMKSLRWIVPEEDCTDELLEFVEDFYTEYGLAIALQPLTGKAAWKRFRLSAPLPVNILDFTGEMQGTMSEIAETSVWLDMLSSEEKRRRIAGRNSGIVYVSLKEKWKYAQRRCNRPVLP